MEGKGIEGAKDSYPTPPVKGVTGNYGSLPGYENYPSDSTIPQKAYESQLDGMTRNAMESAKTQNSPSNQTPAHGQPNTSKNAMKGARTTTK